MLSFTLPEEFVEQYASKPVDWGYKDAGGASLGEITFLRTYSRLKEDGTKERWHEVCRRVVEGMFSIQKDHCKKNRLPWNDHKAQRSARDAYDRMFNFKWTPPGRGLWIMGTPLVNVDLNSAALQNCGFVSTADMTKTDPAGPFCWLMEASMLGVGVGFDDKGADKSFTIYEPDIMKPHLVRIPDSREGWVESVKLLIESYLTPGKGTILFDYCLIRPAGAPIKTFGGTAAGHEPLSKLHFKIRALFDGRAGQLLTRTDIADIGNLIGVCVVSGNVRRSAELLIGRLDDKDFINLKNPEYFPERNHIQGFADGTNEVLINDTQDPGWGWMSNNSVEATVGSDYSHLVDSIALNGEPGLIWMDTTRKFGRLVDPPNNKDWRAAGYNPCAEQSLESYEMCTLVETYLNRHDSLEDFQQTLKFAFMYAKTVTLLPTHWKRTNAIMQRNRRIGCSISGIANFADNRGMTTLRTWLNEGYAKVQNYDRVYSEWLCVRESIKTTTVKPSGTVSILAGESPGVHWAPGGEYFNRAIRFSKDDPMVKLFEQSGYVVEPDVANPETTVVAYFPIHSKALRAEGDVTLFEKANLAVMAQRYWSDNSVSVTLSFDPETEAKHVGTVLHMHEGQLKTVSFLPKGNKVYKQQPYTEISASDYDAATMKLFKVDLTPIYNGDALDAVGEAYCTTDVCEVKTVELNSK
jgi:ribonucleoside-triphosphate reductase